MLSVVMETVETEQRALYVVCGDGNRAEDIACCDLVSVVVDIVGTEQRT